MSYTRYTNRKNERASTKDAARMTRTEANQLTDKVLLAKYRFAFPFILENGQLRLELPTHCTNYAIFPCLHRFLHQLM